MSGYSAKVRCRNCPFLLREEGKELRCKKYEDVIKNVDCDGATESARLAKRIWEIENAPLGERKANIKRGIAVWHIGDGVRLEKSADEMMWYLWKRDSDHWRGYFKAIPIFRLDKEYIERILDAQAWVCI